MADARRLLSPRDRMRMGPAPGLSVGNVLPSSLRTDPASCQRGRSFLDPSAAAADSLGSLTLRRLPLASMRAFCGPGVSCEGSPHPACQGVGFESPASRRSASHLNTVTRRESCSTAGQEPDQDQIQPASRSGRSVIPGPIPPTAATRREAASEFEWSVRSGMLAAFCRFAFGPLTLGA